MKSQKHKTKLVSDTKSYAYDLDIIPNDLDGKRVIFSFNTKLERDTFLAKLETAMLECDCWSELEVSDKGERG